MRTKSCYVSADDDDNSLSDSDEETHYARLAAALARGEDPAALLLAERRRAAALRRRTQQLADEVKALSSQLGLVLAGRRVASPPDASSASASSGAAGAGAMRRSASSDTVPALGAALTSVLGERRASPDLPLGGAGGSATGAAAIGGLTEVGAQASVGGGSGGGEREASAARPISLPGKSGAARHPSVRRAEERQKNRWKKERSAARIQKTQSAIATSPLTNELSPSAIGVATPSDSELHAPTLAAPGTARNGHGSASTSGSGSETESVDASDEESDERYNTRSAGFP